MNTNQLMPSDYKDTLDLVISRVYQTRASIVKSINKEQTQFYWDIGKILFEKTQNNDNWGKGVVNRMSKDLQLEFPTLKGVNPSDLWRAKAFYENYRDSEKLGQLARELPFNHNVRIFERVEDKNAREFYLSQAIKNFWSRKKLEEKIKNDEYKNYLLSQNNYSKNLPVLSEQDLKQASWDFKNEVDIGIIEGAIPIKEKQMEEAVVKNIVRLLSDMGRDFLFAGRQYKVMVDDKEFFIDLLFYHRKLRSFVVVELKAEEFKFEHIGQIQGYLACVDNLVKYEDENPTIGIIICKSKNRTVVEFAIQNTKSPIGVATLKYEALPENISKYLPTEEEIIESVEGFDNENENI